jgi:hypothetical protein
MPKRSSSSKRAPDTNQRAANVVAAATGQSGRTRAKTHRKNPAAVALGRRGGLKGGKARANALSPEERSEIAKRAAAARWKDKPAG